MCTTILKEWFERMAWYDLPFSVLRRGQNNSISILNSLSFLSCAGVTLPLISWFHAQVVALIWDLRLTSYLEDCYLGRVYRIREGSSNSWLMLQSSAWVGLESMTFSLTGRRSSDRGNLVTGMLISWGPVPMGHKAFRILFAGLLR